MDLQFRKTYFTFIDMSKPQHKMELLSVEDWKIRLGQCSQQNNNNDCCVFTVFAATALPLEGQPCCPQNNV